MSLPIFPTARLDEFIRANTSFVEAQEHYSSENRSTHQKFFERYHSLLAGIFDRSRGSLQILLNQVLRWILKMLKIIIFSFWIFRNTVFRLFAPSRRRTREYSVCQRHFGLADKRRSWLKLQSRFFRLFLFHHLLQHVRFYLILETVSDWFVFM
jgi:hypothetical protein